MEQITDEEIVKLSKKKMNPQTLKDDNVVFHPEISTWRDALKPDLPLLRSLNKGQIQGIIFRKRKDGKDELIVGFRRYCHLKLLGWSWDDIKKEIREISDREALIMALSENMYRKDLSPMEQARAVGSMLKAKITIKNLAKLLGRSQSWIRSRKALLELPEKIRDIFEKKELDFGYSVPLRKLQGMEEAQAALVDKIIKGQQSSYYGITKIEEAEKFVAEILKQVEDREALLAKYGPCPKCGSKNIKAGWNDESLHCEEENCGHKWHSETKEPWEFYELKQEARRMGFEIEEGPETLKLTPRDVADMIEQKAEEDRTEKAAQEEELPAKFRCKVPLLTLLEPMIAGDNIQKLEVRDEKIEIQLIEGKDLYFNGLRKDYVAGEKCRIETTGWSGQDSVKKNHAWVNQLTPE